MQHILGLEALKEKLMEFEQELLNSITAELQRINRAVTFEELKADFFREETQWLVEEIRLDIDGIIVITSFADIEDKPLHAMLCDNEIEHWNVLLLLEYLKRIV